MMRIIFLRWKSILKLAVFWTLVTFLTYVAWGIGNSSHPDRQEAALERVGKLLTSPDHPIPIPLDYDVAGIDATNLDDDIDPSKWRLPDVKKISKKMERKRTTAPISVLKSWDTKPKLKAKSKSTKAVYFSGKNQTLNQRLQIQYLTGTAQISEKEAEEFGKRRSDEFCNSHKTIGSGDEGKVLDKYQLINVHVVIRHGARSPIFSLPNHKREPIDCHFESVKNADPLAERFYSAMLNLTAALKTQKRHQRMTFIPQQSKCEGAQLTGAGALQHLKLGEYLKTVYRRKLFPDFTGADEFDKVYIRSTEYTRTFQSAMALLYGFFDTVNIVHYQWEFSKYSTICSSSLSHLQCSCPLAQKLHTTLQKEYQKRAENKTLHLAIKQEIGALLDTPYGKVPFVQAILDVVLGRYCSATETSTHMPVSLPCSTQSDKNCFTWPMVQRLWTYLDGSDQQRVLSSTSSKYSRLLMHPLLHEIATRYQNISHGIADNRFVLYSGHDLTLSPLLGTLGIARDGRYPPFAARLVLELYRGESGSGYFLRAVYNGEDRTRMLRFCDSEDLVDGLCPLHHFLHFVYHRDMQFFGQNSYVDVCAL